MKNFVFKYKYLLIILISIFFLFIFDNKTNAATTDKYIFLGDSRTYHTINFYPDNTNPNWKYNTAGEFSGKVLNKSAIANM